jgi:hypothetical protein
VQNLVLSGITSLGRYNKAKPWKRSVDESIYEPIRPNREIDEKSIIAIQTRREKKLALEKQEIVRMVGA